MPKDSYVQLFSTIKKDRELEELRDALSIEKEKNRLLSAQYNKQQSFIQALQIMIDTKDADAVLREQDIASLQKECSALRTSNHVLKNYLSLPFWKRLFQRAKFLTARAFS